MSRRTISGPARAAQRGISLMVSLVLMVLVTLVGLASMRGVNMEARMAAAALDRNVAFLAAETALREAEARAALAPSLTPAANCASGYCAQPMPGDLQRALDPAFAQWFTATASNSALAATTELLVEDMGGGARWTGCLSVVPPDPNCPVQRYRLSARSAGAGRASVLLEGDYALP